MAILDTFYMLFKTNADEVRKGLKESELAAGTFGAEVNAVGAEVEAAGSRIISVFENVAIRIASAFAIERIGEFTIHAIDLNAELNVTSKRLGIAVEDLDAWQRATVRAGGSAEGLIGTLDFLNRGLAGLNTPGGTSRLKPFLEELKILPATVTGPINLLETLADKAHALGAVKFAGIAERFGIDPGTQVLLLNGRVALDDMIKREKELGVTTKEQAEQAELFKQRMDDLATIFHHVANSIIDSLLPAFDAILDGYTKITLFLEKHSDVVKGFIIALAGTITAFYLPAITEAIIATAVWLAEVLFIPAAIGLIAAALALAYDDVKAFLAGNNSVIGELSKKWPQVGEAVRSMVKFASAAWADLVKVFKVGGNFILAIGKLLVAVYENFSKLFPKISSVLKPVIADFETLLGVAIKIGEAIAKFGLNAVKDWTKGLNSLTASISPGGPALSAAGGQLAFASATPLNAIGGSNSVTTNSNAKHVTVNAPVTINAAPGSDPGQIATAVGDHITTHVRKAINAHDDGVAR